MPIEWKNHQKRVGERDSEGDTDLTDEQAKLVDDDRAVPREWRRASLSMKDDAVSKKIVKEMMDEEVKKPTAIPKDWEMNESSKKEVYNQDTDDEDIRRLARDNMSVPMEWRRASISKVVEDVQQQTHQKKKADTAPIEWRKASMNVGPRTERDHRDRRSSEIFLEEEKKVKQKMGMDVPDSWVGNNGEVEESKEAATNEVDLCVSDSELDSEAKEDELKASEEAKMYFN